VYLSVSDIDRAAAGRLLPQLDEKLRSFARAQGALGVWAAGLAGDPALLRAAYEDELALLCALGRELKQRGVVLEPKVRCGARRVHLYLQGPCTVRMLVSRLPLYLDAEEQEAGLNYHAYACLEPAPGGEAEPGYELAGFTFQDELRLAGGAAGLCYSGAVEASPDAAAARLKRLSGTTPARPRPGVARLWDGTAFRGLVRQALAGMGEASGAAARAGSRRAAPVRMAPRPRWRLAAAGAATVLVVAYVLALLLWPQRSTPPEREGLAATFRRAVGVCDAYAKVEQAMAGGEAFAQVRKLFAGEPLGSDAHGTPLRACATGLRAYARPDGGTVVLIARGTTIDGYSAGPGAQTAAHWQLDLWDAAEALVGAEGVQKAHGYFTEQARQSHRHDPPGQPQPSDWDFYSPGGHVRLHPAVDIDGDGEPEYPVSMMATMHFISRDGRVKASWAAPQGLCGWFYDDVQFADVNGDGTPEAVASVATAYLVADPRIASRRSVVVYSLAGGELGELRLPAYNTLSPLGDYTGRGKIELFATSDLPGNGYEETVQYGGRPVKLTDGEGYIALLGFDGVQPVIEWLASPPEFAVPPQSAVSWYGPQPGGTQWFKVSHYGFGPGSSQYEELYDVEPALIAQGPEAVTRGLKRHARYQGDPPPDILAIVQRSAPPVFLLSRQVQWLSPQAQPAQLHELITSGPELDQNPLHALMLPANMKAPTLLAMPESGGGVLTLVWDSSGAGPAHLAHATADSLEWVDLGPEAHWDGPVLRIAEVESGPGRALFVAVTGKPEFWELAWSTTGR
jgi:hypothetical protein